MSAEGKGGRASAKETWIALGLYLLLTVAMTWPMAANMRHSFARATGDFSYAAWNLWWTAEATTRLQSPFHTDAIYHPDGCSLLWRQMEPFLAVPLTPITRTLGTIFSYNLAFLSSFVLAGLGAYLLARYLTGSRLAAFCAGLVYGFHPLQFITYPTLSYAHIQWLPFMVLALLRLRDEGRLRHGVWAGVWLAFLFQWSSIYYGIYGGLTVALFGLWFLIVPGERVADRATWIKGLALCAATTFVLVSFRFIPMALEAGGGVETDVAQHNYADLLGLQARLEPDGPRDLVSWPSVLGYLTLIGATLGAWAAGWRRARLWLVTAGGFFLIALGTTLSVAGREIKGLPMPVDLLRVFPLLNSLRVYVEAILVVTLALSVLFAFWIRSLERREAGADEPILEGLARPRVRPRWLAPGVALLLLAEFWPARPVPYPDSVPPFYRELAQEPGHRAVLSIPFNEETDSRAPLRSMFLQTVHGKPLISGHVGSRPDPHRSDRYRRSAFLAHFFEGELTPFPLPDEATAAGYRQELADLGVGTVVLNTGYILPAGSVPPEKGRSPIVIRLPVLLWPVWWGPIAKAMVHPPDDMDREGRIDPPYRQKRLDPSVLPFLKAVLGEPDRKLEDGALAWRLGT